VVKSDLYLIDFDLAYSAEYHNDKGELLYSIPRINQRKAKDLKKVGEALIKLIIVVQQE